MSVFSVEHIAPRISGGTNEMENPALSCQDCNNHKFTATQAIDPLTGKYAPLFHPRRDEWNIHFAWADDYSLLAGKTPTGRATIERLQMNRANVVNLRRVFWQVGQHPPADL